eukprot:CAMPEP_0181460460 /NCGR_PEP_ID=MMETSP1110-20121109/33351_1 /TAXON_ID=174948 /ORGANISM="Symbiodinium sp., Strain CCMP421" /LENGTH=55 /DNA_ID=CAMNT_0023585009 /DNA_START=108 /DNA_END=275 /DNA_ORIENTATION=-
MAAIASATRSGLAADFASLMVALVALAASVMLVALEMLVALVLLPTDPSAFFAAV